MGPPVAVYVVAAVVSVAAVFAFKEFIYEPHLAPKLEAWAEDFLERRRAARNRRASAVPVGTSRRRRSSSSSNPSHHDNDPRTERSENGRNPGLNDLVDGFELEALAPREVDEWRNEVLRSQRRNTSGLRMRKMNGLGDESDGFDSMSTTLDESFTSLTHTPLASTHVISNVSSPITSSTVSLPQTPARRSLAATQESYVAPPSPSLLIHGIPMMSTEPSGSGVPTPRPITDGGHFDVTSPFPLAIPSANHRSPAPHPLPFTPTHQVAADDSPFGPLLPDTPRSSAEMYGERPFSPITRVMVPSRANSTSSTQTLGSSGVLRNPSRLVNEVVMNGSDDGNEENDLLASTPTSALVNSGPGMNESVISSLSERYPAPPTPPVIISPPASSVDVISVPSSPHSDNSEIVMHNDVIAAEPGSPPQTLPQMHSSLPLLRLPSDASDPGLISRSRSAAHSATSPALSFVSFLSPMPISRAASESEGDEFLSVASEDSDWNASPVTPNRPMQDVANNPFLDFEHLTHGGRVSGSEHGDGSENSEVLISDPGQEAGSEAGSEESWGSARRH